MRPLKIVTVVGARPQFIKAAVICRAVDAHNAQVADGRVTAAPIDEVLLHTGQHYDAGMSQVFFDELKIPAPKYNLNVGSAPHGRQTADMLVGIERVLLDERPDIVLVYGDTNSTLAGAMAAAKLNIPIAHVEAGLRSFNRRMPEEINRILTDSISDWLFCPTNTAVENLANEGRVGPEHGVHHVGDVMYDSVLFHVAHSGSPSELLGRIGVSPRAYYLATIHRAENTDEPARLATIIAALGALDLPVLLPLHPRTRARAAAMIGEAAVDPLVEHGTRSTRMHYIGKITQAECGNLLILAPLPYVDLLLLEKNAAAVLTDSGGMQKESFMLGTPCITLRDETEWNELVEIGANRLVGADPGRIREAVNWAKHWKPPAISHLYGDGRAAKKILDVLANWHESRLA